MYLPMCKNKCFWLENPLQLLCTFNTIPLDGMSWEEKMNSLTRFVVILWIIFYLLGCKFNFIFLVISLMLIISLYYLQKENTTQREYYDETILSNKTLMPFKKTESVYSAGMTKDYLQAGIPDKFLDNTKRYNYSGDDNKKVTYLDFNESVNTGNQQWVGYKADPRTKNAPIITPPQFCDAWIENTSVVPSGINSATNEYLYRSGYAISADCDDISLCLPEDYHFNSRYRDEKREKCGSKNQDRFADQPVRYGTEIIEGFESYPSLDKLKLGACCNDNLSQLQKYNLPSNYNASKFEQTDGMTKYNQNMFTQNINDSTLSRSELIEPVNSNMGISYAYQFEPIEVSKEGDRTVYTSKDPRNLNVIREKIPQTPNTSNVYDPRSTGYGTSYRSYLEPVTGQTRFYYDDVDCIRKPNNISRNNIDFATFGQQYGPMKSNGDIYQDNRNVRMMAEQTFVDNAIGFRNDIQERLVRNYNNKIGWQRRMAPINTYGASNISF